TAGQTMRISSAEIGRMFATRLRVGDDAAPSVTFQEAVAPANISSLTVRADGGISQAAGATITVPSFEASSLNSRVILNENNNVGTLAGQALGVTRLFGDPFSFTNAASMQVGSVFDF